MKKKILFVIESLNCAGAEKSLVALLNMIDYSHYEVHLQLFAQEGVLKKFLPKQVKVLDNIKLMDFNKLPLYKAIGYSIRYKQLLYLKSRLLYSLKIKIFGGDNHQQARWFWENSHSSIAEKMDIYDIAIAYAQGIPTYYMIQKVKAKKRIAWVNGSYNLDKKELEFEKDFYKKCNKICIVSDAAKENFIQMFPEEAEKIEIIYDIINPHTIVAMANSEDGYIDKFLGIKILTIGRLTECKGYHLALEACKILKQKNINFRWYILGEGPLQVKIEKYIEENALGEQVYLLGIKENPYPYIKNCDIYVQTSLSEGFGIAIAEAKILNKPIVATNFASVHAQLNNKNGVIVNMESEDICKGILALINDTKLKDNIVNTLKSEKKGNMEEVHKIYQLIN